MNDFITKLRDSKNRLLQGEADDIARWQRLKHNKTDFELFLNFNVAEIKFRTKEGKDSTIFCTSNTTLIKLFSTKKAEDKKKVARINSLGIHTKEMDSVLTWDLIDNKYKTIYLKSWAIMNFVSITPENIEVLDKVINDLLKR